MVPAHLHCALHSFGTFSNAPTHLHAQRGGSAGYTLIEAVISLVIVSAILVPLIFGIYRSSALAASRRELTGVWLIEREAAVVRTFPHEALPTKRQRIGNDEWTITTEITGADPLLYRMTAHLRGSVEAEARFYGRPRDAGK